jgi:hypothetical protein
MIRTFCDHKKQSHTLDLDAVLVDGVQCLSVQATEHYVQFELQSGEAVTCELGQFWQQIAGPDLSAPEAGVLLAECLTRQVVMQRTSSTLHEAMCLLTRATALPAEIPSFLWLTTRLDPFARQAMAAYDGTPEVTAMLARILQRDPTTIREWANALGFFPTAPVVAPSQDVADRETAVAGEDGAEESPREGEKKLRFRWTPERQAQLEQALATCTGNTVAEQAEQIAGRCGWPVDKIRSKLYELRNPDRHAVRPAAREAETEQQEDDQRAEQLEVAPVE